MGFSHYGRGHRRHDFSEPETRGNALIGSLVGGGVPLLFGVVLVPLGVHFVAQGPDTESLGTIFVILGALMAITGIVLVFVLWPERRPPSIDDAST